MSNLQKNPNKIWQPPISRQPPTPNFALTPFLAKIFSRKCVSQTMKTTRGRVLHAKFANEPTKPTRWISRGVVQNMGFWHFLAKKTGFCNIIKRYAFLLF